MHDSRSQRVHACPSSSGARKGGSDQCSTVHAGLEQCRWPGRCQVVPAGPGLTLYLDGAHTEDSINCCLRWWREAAASEQQALGTKVQVRRILLFNCIGDRRPEVLLSYLADEPFHTALFTPNRLTIDKSPYSGGELASLRKCCK